MEENINIPEGLLECMPEDVANLQLPAPFLRDYYRDEKERVFRVDDEINDGLLELVKMIMRCNAEDKGKPIEERQPIKVYICSPGGDIVPLWTAMQAIQMSKTPVWTVNLCYAYSAAFELLVAGQKRFALKGTQGMAHRGSTFIGGETSVVENTQKHFSGLEKKLTDFLLEHTKIDPKMYKRKASSDIYFDEDEMLKSGVVDKIVSDFDEII